MGRGKHEFRKSQLSMTEEKGIPGRGINVSNAFTMLL